ncbi:hypothetical protein BCV70DRAFT_139093, partial [Testicularia cyperi]
PSSASSLASLLPQPRSQAEGRTSGLSLPPPKSVPGPSRAGATSTKRKLQIKVDALQAEGNEDADFPVPNTEPEVQAKKTKLTPGASSNRSSLFGMLPAPKRKDEEIRAERQREAQERRAAKQDSESSGLLTNASPMTLRLPAATTSAIADDEDDNDDNDIEVPDPLKPQSKTNDAFRAMLGLKPVSQGASASRLHTKTTAQSNILSSASPPNSRPHAKGIALPPPKSHDRQNVSTTLPETRGGRPGQQATGSDIPAAPKQDSLLRSDPPAAPSGRKTASSIGPSFRVAAAPAIEQPETALTDNTPDTATSEPDAYPGWQLDPDGSWVPVTPEAHAQYQAWMTSNASQSVYDSGASSSSSRRANGNLDGTRDLISAGIDLEQIQAFDAGSAARAADNAGETSNNDDRYAAAASFAAGNRDALVQQRPGHLKGLRKGQLSSLVSLAQENRSKLEQQWQHGREARHRAGNQYGF